jgi:catechol 2,3-dioxygenase-like lactoylglutathione lyase family enzyme
MAMSSDAPRCLSTIRTLHTALRVTDLDRSIAFYEAVGYGIVGRVTETPIGELTMLKLPDDEFVTIELVHDPSQEVARAGTSLSHFVIAVECMGTAISELSARGVDAGFPRHQTARSTSSPHRSSTPTATELSWCSGLPVTRPA